MRADIVDRVEGAVHVADRDLLSGDLIDLDRARIDIARFRYLSEFSQSLSPQLRV